MVKKLGWLFLWFGFSNWAGSATYDPFASITPPMSQCFTSQSLRPEIIYQFLSKKEHQLRSEVIEKVMAVLSCLDHSAWENNQTLSIIDYALPSNQKRFWIFDLSAQKLMIHTYLSHGLYSGGLVSNHFSNVYDSKSSSIGVFKTNKSYYGRHGLSLKLDGLERGFNDNAANRAIVIHGAWYVEEDFIRKYGRAGRSWGCPAVPDRLVNTVIDLIKNQSLVVVYYPHDDWLSRSNYLNCQKSEKPRFCPKNLYRPQPDLPLEEPYGILFVDKHNNHQYLETEPVLAMNVEDYQEFFGLDVPLTRLLRRQISGADYLVLTGVELIALENKRSHLRDYIFYLIRPDIKMKGGYYVTDMKIVERFVLSDGNSMRLDPNTSRKTLKYATKIECAPLNASQSIDCSIDFSNQEHLKFSSSKRFIRWMGL